MIPPLPPQTLRLRVGVQPRDPERFPDDDERLGEELSGRLATALERGVPPPVLVVLRADRVEIVDLRPVLEAPVPVDMFLAAAAGQEGVEAVGLLAVMERRAGDRVSERLAVAFLEWPDNRWWHAWCTLPAAPGTTPVPALSHSRALEGSPRPRGLGGWFSRARFHRLRLQVRPMAPEEQGGAGGVVH